jgi:hypothetical protein
MALSAGDFMGLRACLAACIAAAAFALPGCDSAGTVTQTSQTARNKYSGVEPEGKGASKGPQIDDGSIKGKGKGKMGGGGKGAL